MQKCIAILISFTYLKNLTILKLTNMKTYPTILLPTDKIGNLFLSQDNHLKYCDINEEIYPLPIRIYNPMQFFIIDSSAEIKEGDIVFYPAYSKIGKIDRTNILPSIKFCQKIIVSTDKSITPNSWIDISKSMWIIDHFNANGKMPDVQLEMEEYPVGNYGTSDGEPIIDSRIKLVNGSVIIKPIEDKHDYYKHESQLAKAKLNTEQKAEEEMNQCDGCQAGLPLENGVHKDHQTFGIACTKDRYKKKLFPEEKVDVEKLVISFIETLDDLHNRGLIDVFKSQNKELFKKLNYFIQASEDNAKQYSREQVVNLLAKVIKDNITGYYSLEKWIADNLK